MEERGFVIHVEWADEIKRQKYALGEKKHKEKEYRIQIVAVKVDLGLIPTPPSLHNEVANDGEAAEDLPGVDGVGKSCPFIPDEFVLPRTEYCHCH